MDELQSPAEEAGNDVVQPDESQEQAIEEGQAAPVEAEGDTPGDAEKPTKSQLRRERQKAYQERLQQEKAEAQRKAEEAEARRARIVSPVAEPQEADFDDLTEYAAAKAVWGAFQQQTKGQTDAAEAEAKAAKEALERVSQQERQALEQNYAQSAEEARERYTDYDQVTGNSALFPDSAQALIDGILKSESPADVAYAVASDRALHDRLAKLPPVAVARELGRLEASLTKPTPRTVSKSPEPIEPGRPTGGSVTKSPDKMSAAEYRAFRESGGTL